MNVEVECLHVLKDLSDFVLVLDLRCYTLYFTINNLANLNFILATKVNRGWILVCLPLSDNFFGCLIFKVYLGEMKNKTTGL